MQRRTFTSGLAGLLATLFVDRTHGSQFPRRDFVFAGDGEVSGEWMSAAIKIGRHVRACYPDLVLGLPSSSEIAADASLDMRECVCWETFRRKVTHDFRAGHVLLVNGWVLSRSEAQAYAVLALLSESWGVSA